MQKSVKVTPLLVSMRYYVFHDCQNGKRCLACLHEKAPQYEDHKFNRRHHYPNQVSCEECGANFFPLLSHIREEGGCFRRSEKFTRCMLCQTKIRVLEGVLQIRRKDSYLMLYELPVET